MLSKDANIRNDLFLKIFKIIDCEFEDIMEIKRN